MFLSLDTEEVAEYTEVEQSDLEDEQERPVQSNDWKVEDASDSNHNQGFYVDEFTAELYRAAADGVPDIQRAETNWVFESALDIPVIKQERGETIAGSTEHDEEIDGGTGDEESEEDVVDQLCECTTVPDIGASYQKSEEVYGFCWTGM